MSAINITDSIESGATYRAADGQMIEQAKVLSVGSDRADIPHVRFELQVTRCGCGAPSVEQRTLALASFRARYREKVQ